MARPKNDPKTEALRQQGCLHPHPEKVTDEAFDANEFFDPRDLVQVKYEMLRRVRVDGQPHKLSAEVVEALCEALLEQPELRSEDLVALVGERFGVSVHRRSIERALVKQEKKRR